MAFLAIVDNMLDSSMNSIKLDNQWLHNPNSFPSQITADDRKDHEELDINQAE